MKLIKGTWYTSEKQPYIIARYEEKAKNKTDGFFGNGQNNAKEWKGETNWFSNKDVEDIAIPCPKEKVLAMLKTHNKLHLWKETTTELSYEIY
jgi:hypothetical protein